LFGCLLIHFSLFIQFVFLLERPLLAAE